MRLARIQCSAGRLDAFDGCIGCAASDVVSRSVGRREAVLDARAPAISVVSEARHIQRSERSGVLARTHCGGRQRLEASDLVAAVMSTHAARRASAGTGQHHGSAGRRLDARAPAISVSEARHIQGSERPGGLTCTHCGGGRRCGANDLVPNGVATGATVRLARVRCAAARRLR